jgi:arylsulfatase A-like enzyme
MKRLNNIRRSGRVSTVVLFAALAIAPVPSAAVEDIPHTSATETSPASAAGTTRVALDHKPNIVFILADNVGYGDLGSYGGGELRGAPTPRLDELASQGMRLTQFLVEPGCTPSRAALMTAQYSIRSGLSLIIVPGTANTLPANAFTMAQMFKQEGYATAIFGKWHLGKDPQSLPTSHGFDEFYGIPPDTSWSAFTTVPQLQLTHAVDLPRQVLLEKGPQIVEAKAGEALRNVKPYTEEVRRNIDTELVNKSIDFIKRQKAAGKPFFLYLPFSMGHFPNLPSKEFEGKSRIGNYGDKIMEGDFHVGQVLDALKETALEDNTIVVFCSDNGPEGQGTREFGNLQTPDMGNSGPFRGELGNGTEGSIRTAAIIRWPDHIKPGSTSYAMFSIMDFFPTLANIVGGKMPADHSIDGVDQTDVLLAKDNRGPRETLLTFVGDQIVAARWKQFRLYFTDEAPTGHGPQRLPGVGSTSAQLNGYPKIFNIEADPHEELNIAQGYPWVLEPVLKAVVNYKESLKAHPNPPASNMTRF